ncbi:MAG: hypothetical protein ABIQ30_00425 [Devosia sp.]
MLDFSAIDQQARRVLLFRFALIATGSAALAVAAGFLFGWPFIVRIWPFPNYGLSPIFVASIFAAIGAPVIWIGLSAEFAALRGGAANICLTAGGIAAYCLWRSWGTPGSPLQMFGIGNLSAAMIAFVLFFASRGLGWSSERPMPAPVRWSFVGFAVVLFAVGGALLWRLDVFPWPLERDTSAVYGCFFVGSAVYFVAGVLQPVWANAKGQLIGFLAYDLVLILPFARLWPVAPSISLAVYLTVIIYSAALAIWYLLFAPSWRLLRPA